MGLEFCVASLKFSSKFLNINHSLIMFHAAAKRSWASWSTNLEIVWPVPLSVISAVVWHLILGVKHASVWNTSVAAMLEVVDEGAGGSEDGYIVRTCTGNTATGIYF